MLWSFTGSANFNSSIQLGVCSGTTNPFSSATCSNFYGTDMSFGGAGAWVYNAGTLWPYYSQSTAGNLATRRVNTTTGGLGESGSDGRHFSAGGCRSLLMLEINRAVAATTSTAVAYTAARRSTTLTNSQFNACKQQLIGMRYVGLAASGLASGNHFVNTMGSSSGTLNNEGASTNFDESTGVLNAFNLRWDVASRDMQICGLAAHKVF